MADARDQSALELQALQRVVATGARALDLDAVLDRCLEQARAVAGAEAGVIYLRDEKRSSYRAALAHGAITPITPSSLDLSALDQAAPAERVLIDLAKFPTHHPARSASLAAGFTHALLLRLTVESERVGFLALSFRTEPTLAESTLHTLDAIAAFEAVAIASARAHRQLQLRERLASTLRDAAQQILDAEDPAPIILEAACAIGRADRALISRIGERAGKPISRIVHAIGKDVDLIGFELPVDAPYLDSALAQPGPFVVEDTAILQAGTAIGDAARRHATASFLLITVRQHGRVFGQIFAGSGEPRTYEEAEIQAMQLLSSLAAQALQRAERHAEERALQERIAAILEHLPVSVAVLDKNGEILHVNAAARAFGERMVSAGGRDWRANMAGMQVLDLDGRVLPASEHPMTHAFAGETSSREVQLIGASGQRAYALTIAVPLRGPGGEVESVLTSFQDVTELRELANTKDRFLSIASHELRSPITSLRATTSLLQLDPTALTDDTRRAQLLSRVQRQIDRLSTLVERLLDTTRLNAGELPLELVDCELGALCRDVVEGQRLTDREHVYVLDAPVAVPGRWDAARLEQVVTNLLANACRYSPANTEITVRVRGDGERATVDVIDRGPGIAADQLDKLFTPFYRGAAAARHKGGLGLGLFISREIVRRHGGQLRIASTPGQGSTFTIDLPRHPG